MREAAGRSVEGGAANPLESFAPEEFVLCSKCDPAEQPARHCHISPLCRRRKAAVCGGPSILRQRTPAIREPGLAQDLRCQLFVDVRRYQFANGKRSRIELPHAATGPALW